ncbi:MAG: hypothetical protein EOO10_22060 [Chitinophagaceae bacterium]|nr:MAG: hypothetical protein EOO10_22060 [Chitinophagaceae bacterium]
MRILTLLLVFSLIACTQAKNKTTTADGQDSEVVDAKKELQDSLSIFKAQYLTVYEDRVANATEASRKEAIRAFNNVLMNVTGYMDSLWAYVDTMDYNAENNIYLMRSKFVEERLGDTLYNRLNGFFEQARKVAPSSAHPVIDAKQNGIFHNQDVNGWKRQNFWLVNPLGVGILLYGFQSAVLKTAYQTKSKTNSPANEGPAANSTFSFYINRLNLCIRYGPFQQGNWRP